MEPENEGIQVEKATRWYGQVIGLNPYPEIGRGCISCFCCVELCPNGALEVDLPDNIIG